MTIVRQPIHSHHEQVITCNTPLEVSEVLSSIADGTSVLTSYDANLNEYTVMLSWNEEHALEVEQATLMSKEIL